MKNKEKYAKEIVEIACSGDALAVSKVTGKPISCTKSSCEHCNCYNDFLCEENRLREWAESEYISKPHKLIDCWESSGCESDKSLKFFKLYFPMVKWSDGKPWLIEDLKKLEVVEEYE